VADLFEIVKYTNDLLNISAFKDYCPNGLQVEGKRDVATIVSGVTASRALIERAIAVNADALLVHHGYFWRGEALEIIGIKRERIGLLIKHDMSLLGYHLPLDAHESVGNNAQIAQKLAINIEGRFAGDTSIGMYGQVERPYKPHHFKTFITQQLGREPLHINPGEREIRKVAWCTGGAQSYFESAVSLGVDAYITGEASESCFHLAMETGVHFFAAGHHATERYGVQALAQQIQHEFDVVTQFIDVDNPI